MAESRAQLERLTRDQYASFGNGGDGRDTGRLRVFIGLFVAVFLAGLIYTALQPARYRSTASVLMSAPRAIDAPAATQDAQNVAIQRRILLGNEITTALASALDARGLAVGTEALRGMLSVEAIPETNLVELAATGSEAGTLPTAVDAWIDVYTEVRARDIRENKASSIARVEEERTSLDQSIREAREALAAFRAANDIVSAEREQNAVMSRLDGLNAALREAEAEEVRAKVYLETVRGAIDRDRLVLPEAQRGELRALEKELQELRTELTVLRKRYTPEYIERDATLRQMPRRIERLEAEIATLLDTGSRLELDNAQRAYDAARAAVRELEARLAAHREAVEAFNDTYATHSALEADLGRLEELRREAQARLAQIEARRVDRYPQVTVIEEPALQSTRIGPDYWLLAGLSLAAALLTGIGGVWLRSFLSPRRPTQAAYVTLSGVHFYPQQSDGELAYTGNRDPAIGRDRRDRLERDPPGDGN